MSFGLSESHIAKFKQSLTTEHVTMVKGEICLLLQEDRFRALRTESLRPLAEHTGPRGRGGLCVDLNNPGHQYMTWHCNGTHNGCLACRMGSIDDAKSRLEILTASKKIYLEQHHLASKGEVRTLRGKASRATDATACFVVIELNEHDLYVITTARVGGMALWGEGRIDRVNNHADKAAMRTIAKGCSLLRFNDNWPQLEKAPKHSEQVASAPDTITAGDAPEAPEPQKAAPKAVETPVLNEEESIALIMQKLQRCEGVAVSRGITFSGSKGMSRLDLWISLETLINPLKHCRIHLAIGYHCSPVFYERARRWAEQKLAEKAEKLAA